MKHLRPSERSASLIRERRRKRITKLSLGLLFLTFLQIVNIAFITPKLQNSSAAVAPPITNNQCAFEPDGINWQLANSPTSAAAPVTSNWSDVAYGNGRFVAVASAGTSRIVTSVDGLSWDDSGLALPAGAQETSWSSISFSLEKSLFVAVGYSSDLAKPVLITSADGLTWTSQSLSSRFHFSDITFGHYSLLSMTWVIISTDGANRVFTGYNGTSWTARTAAQQNSWQSVTFGNGVFVAVASDGTNRVMTSPTGTSWTARTAAEQNSWQSVTFGNGVFVAVASDGTNRVMTSSDGITWNVAAASQQNSWQSVSFGNGAFIAVSSDGSNRIMRSVDGVNWTTGSAASSRQFSQVRFAGNLFISLATDGDSNRLMISGSRTTSTSDGADLYLSAPFVQGPPAAYGAQIETFDTLNVSPVDTNSFGWYFSEPYGMNAGLTAYGGATTTSDEATIGGTRSKFGFLSGGTSWSIKFPKPVCYLGFWWPTVNSTNIVNFYQPGSSSPFLTYTPATISDRVGGALKPFPCPGTQTLQSLDGSSYNRGYYFNSPSQLSSLTPTACAGPNAEAWVFVNLFTTGAISIGKIEFVGAGFEPDNLSVSTKFQEPTGGMVFVSSVVGKSIIFSSNGGSGLMSPQTSKLSASIKANSFSYRAKIFTGWNTNADGTGTPYAPESTYDFANAPSDLTLYAQWKNRNFYTFWYPDASDNVIYADSTQNGITGDRDAKSDDASIGGINLLSDPDFSTNFGTLLQPIRDTFSGRQVESYSVLDNYGHSLPAITRSSNGSFPTIEEYLNQSFSQTQTIEQKLIQNSTSLYSASAPIYSNWPDVYLFPTFAVIPTPTPSASVSAAASVAPPPAPPAAPPAPPAPEPVETVTPTATPSVPTSSTPTASPSPSPSSTATYGPTPSASAYFAPVPVTSPSVGNRTRSGAVPQSPETSVEPSATQSPSDEPTPLEVIAMPPLKSSKTVSLTDLVSDVIKPKTDPAIGATGNDFIAPQHFSPLATLEGAKRMLSIAAWFVVLMVSSVVAGFGRERKSLRLGALAEVDASIHLEDQRRRGWGDKLWIFRFKFVTWLDKFSADAIRVTYPKSPVLAKIFNEGAYLRAFFGSFTVLGTLAAGLLGWYAATSRDPLSQMPSTWLLLAIVAIGVFDAFAGLISTFVLVVAVLFTIGDATIQDYRLLLGIFILGYAPALAAETFRSVRRRVERTGSYRWERFSDFAIAPFIGGVSTVAMVSALPALANLTLSVANHVLEFGITVSLAMVIRVALEEFAARAYPQRSDILNPSDLKQPTKMRKFISILMKAALYIFISTAIFGLSWQVYVACLLFVIPSLIHLFADRLPNSRFMWRLLPKGIPGMALSLSIAILSVTYVTIIVNNPKIMAQYGFVLLAVPALALTLAHAIGRHGGENEVKPILHPNRKWAYRIGGVVMFLVTVGLTSMA